MPPALLYVFAIIAVCVLLWVMRPPSLPECAGCHEPLVDGHFACRTDGACFCRTCAKRLGLPAWYEAGKPEDESASP